ncbi:MAG TPA: PIN domain-containing protein [Candidatus Limnocylindrales bacterium]|nr:PIN domain-containing protein [Candidatus Limnocylindrales bacterium]
MTANEFLDTNIVLYAFDDSEPRKQSIAQELLRKAVRAECVISVQVLSEICNTILRKLVASHPIDLLRVILDQLEPVPTVSPDERTVRRAVDCRERYGLHFYDGMIVAAAERAGCKKIWSEDLNTGQEYFGIKVENPFV